MNIKGSANKYTNERQTKLLNRIKWQTKCEKKEEAAEKKNKNREASF